MRVYGVKQTLSFSIVIHIICMSVYRWPFFGLVPFISKSHNVGYNEIAGKRILFDIFLFVWNDMYILQSNYCMKLK